MSKNCIFTSFHGPLQLPINLLFSFSMKLTGIFGAMLLCSVVAQGQINPVSNDLQETTIGEVKNFGAFLAKCVRFVSLANDTSYSIFFKNDKYQSITDIQFFSFSETGGDFVRLSNMVMDNLKAKEKKDITIPLKDGTLILSFEKNIGKPFLKFIWQSRAGVISYSEILTLKQCKKLFGIQDE